MPPPSPDQVDRLIGRSRALLDDLEHAYRLAYEVGYSRVARGEGPQRGCAAAADPTAQAALSRVLEDERQLVGAAAARVREAQRVLQCALRDARDALRIVGGADGQATPPNLLGPLLSRAELEEARRMQLRHNERHR